MGKTDATWNDLAEFFGSELDAKLSEGIETMKEIVGESWARYRDEPEFKFAVDRTYDTFSATDMAVFIVGSAEPTARMVLEAQDQAYLDGVVTGAAKAALLLNADVIVEEIEDTDEPVLVEKNFNDGLAKCACGC